MSSTSYFSPAFGKESNPNSLGQKTHARSKKRNRAALIDDSETEGQRPSDFSISNFSSDRETTAATGRTSSHDTTQQYRVAGVLSAEDIPGGRFPHGPLVPQSHAGKCLDKEELNAEFARLKLPIYPSGGHATNNAPDTDGDSTLLRQKHLGILTAIMHKCLLQSDYIRAGRVWGMLLRSELNAQPLDIRGQGRWGIGAEILFQRDAQIATMQSKSPDVDALSELGQDVEGSAAQDTIRFSRQGFNEAKSYYESLILQYPFRKVTPHAVDSLFFYPAMFGLWIYSVQEQQRDALATLSELRVGQDSNSDTSARVDAQQERAPNEQREVVQKSTLRQAEAIGTRLDELMVSPPYSDDAMLWKLRGMVELWAGDLSILSQPSPIRADDSGHEGTLFEDENAEGSDPEERMEAALARNQYEQSLTAKQAHVGRARVAFEKAIKLDGRMGRGLKYMVPADHA